MLKNNCKTYTLNTMVLISNFYNDLIINCTLYIIHYHITFTNPMSLRVISMLSCRRSSEKAI